MTTVQQAGGASPVDFAAFGDYGDFRRKQPQPATGEFVRPAYPFRGRITADGSSGYPAVAGRYHLYISWACPWAHRTAMATEPGYDGHISVPVLWDRQTGRIVSSNFPDITIDLDTQFGAFSNGTDLYPAALRPEIDAINAVVYQTVNNGVYRSGMAASQEAYHDAASRVFATLDDLEQRLAGRRYLLGDAITEADVRLWVTLARFDAVYHYHFKVNLRRLTDYPNLWGYARDLYSLPAFAGTTNFDHIKRHYYTTHPHINPTRIVPDGPLLDWAAPHNRALS